MAVTEVKLDRQPHREQLGKSPWHHVPCSPARQPGSRQCERCHHARPRAGKSIVSPNSVITARVAIRQWQLMFNAHSPATDASVATVAKVSASPRSNGKLPSLNGWSASASTNGNIGKMQGDARREQAGCICKGKERH